MTRFPLSGVLLGVLGFAFMACAPPKIMVGDSFLPGTEKVARESIKDMGASAGGDKSATLTNYYVQVCDVVGTRQTNCRTSLLLENITNYKLQKTWE